MKALSAVQLERGYQVAVLFLFVVSAPLGAEVIVLYPEADSKVDTQVPFPYQGTSPQLYVGHDAHPTLGWTTRSYLRFSLAGVSPVDRILSARLNLYADTIWQGGNVDLYRSENDSWPENAINFASQPGWSGPRLDTLFITSIGVNSFELLRLGNWEPWMDIDDGKVTLLIKTPEITTMTGISFSSREGAFTPSLVLTTRSPGEILDPDFEEGGEPYQTSGTVRFITDPGDPANHVALLETASQSSIWQTIDTPDAPFTLAFDASFLTPTGTFTISLGGDVLLTVTSPDNPPGGLLVADPSMRNRIDMDLKFTLDGPDGATSQLLLDHLLIRVLPEPPLAIAPDFSRNEVTVSFYAAPGAWYDIQKSTDAMSWTDHGRRIAGLDLIYEETLPAEQDAEFFRLAIIPHSEPGNADIENWDFELPLLNENVSTTIVPGWTSSGGAGVWDPPASIYPSQMVDGENVAYVHNGHSLRQTVPEVLEAYRVYTLDAMVGRRSDIGFPTASPPDLILRAGGVTLTPDELVSPNPAVGTFELWIRTFRIGKTHPQLGQPLEIVLDGGVSGIVSQVNIDSVVLGIE